MNFTGIRGSADINGMNWLLLAGCGIMAWVALCVISGERLRRVQEKEVERMSREASDPVHSQ